MSEGARDDDDAASGRGAYAGLVLGVHAAANGDTSSSSGGSMYGLAW